MPQLCVFQNDEKEHICMLLISKIKGSLESFLIAFTIPTLSIAAGIP